MVVYVTGVDNSVERRPIYGWTQVILPRMHAVFHVSMQYLCLGLIFSQGQLNCKTLPASVFSLSIFL